MSPATIFATFAAEGVDVSSYDSIRELDLKHCDRSVPKRKEKYVALAAGQGAATSLAVTGATVSSTVSGGTTLGVAAGAIVVDVTAVLVGMAESSPWLPPITDTTCAIPKNRCSRPVF